jgi:fumarate hydratase class II
LAIAGFEVRRATIDATLARNPILATALNPLIGYERAAAIAKQAYAQGRPIIDVAEELGGLDGNLLRQRLDPSGMTGVGSGSGSRKSKSASGKRRVPD